jgi:thioredoxin-like negative regulator of GroEL
MTPIRYLAAMILLSASLLFGTAAPVAAEDVPWRYDYNAARKEAKEKNKPIVLDFGTANCHWCKQLDMTTFRDPAIIKALTERFIPVKIDAGKNPELAQALGINSFPTLVFAAPNGKILGQHDGYIDAETFSRQLNRLVGDGSRPGLASSSPETNVHTGDRAQRARDLLAQAKEEYRQQNDAAFLERCNLLTASFAGSPEAAEAQRLAAQIKNEPERLAQVCERLTDSLGNTYLDLAESLLRKGQAQQALSYLEKTVRTCPGTHAAQLAQERLLEVRDQLARQADAKGVVRTQSP